MCLCVFCSYQINHHQFIQKDFKLISFDGNNNLDYEDKQANSHFQILARLEQILWKEGYILNTSCEAINYMSWN